MNVLSGKKKDAPSARTLNSAIQWSLLDMQWDVFFGEREHN